MAVHLHDGHVLDYDRIGSGFLHREHLTVSRLELIVVEYCVQSDEDPRSVSVRMFAKLPDILNGVSGSLTGSELRTGYIHSIGTAVDCCDADLCVSCRSKQFKLSH